MSVVEGPRPADDLEDSAVLHAVEEYLAAMKAGRRPDRESFLGRHPAIAGPLAECLDALVFVQAAASSLAGTSRSRSAPMTGAGLPDLDTLLGDYRIVREVGRGGMGVVYEAEQISLGRRIALKVLPTGMTLDPRHLQRFKNEAQAAAQLHHPNIVPVFAVGHERGVHFYAMQFIEGQTLASLVGHLRRRKGAPAKTDDGTTEPIVRTTPEGVEPSPPESGRLASFSAGGPSFVRSVLQLGVQAAEALEYAHQTGVVHRDVKPSNLMVDGRGHLWVTDFGLARCQSDPSLTAPGDIVGTLRYMPPEQALESHGAADHRADIYALGATLYELLTLEPPFRGRDRRELLRQIEHDEPRPLRRANPDVPADLDTVVLKALAKNPAERYATAQELADDLRRVLEDKPVRARRPGWLERVARWARRNAGLVRLATLGLMLSVVGLSVTTLLVAREQVRAQAAYEAEARQRAQAEVNFHQAEENFRQAREAVDFFAGVSADELPNRPELLEVRRKLLNGALSYYQEFIDRRRNDPATQTELAVSHFRVAAILDRLGAQAEAEQAYEQARLLEEKLIRENRIQPGPGLAALFGGKARPQPKLPDSGLMYLLTQKAVQADLGLTPEQIREIGRLDDGRASEAEQKERELAFLAALESEQSRRLRQIALQQRGTDALAEPQIADTLELSSAQRERVRKFLTERRNVLGMGPFSDPRRRAEVSSPTALLDILTPAQKARWKEMLGEPVRNTQPPPAPRAPVPQRSINTRDGKQRHEGCLSRPASGRNSWSGPSFRAGKH